MQLSVREAATLLGKSPRTVRAQLARGELVGVKRLGRWLLERRHLPLGPAERRRMQQKADRIRAAVEEALPSRLARTPGDRRRSIADLDAFRLGAGLLSEVRQTPPEEAPETLSSRVAALLEEALLDLATGVQHFDRSLKLAAVERARGRLAQAVAVLLLEGGIPPASPVAGWVDRLESEVIPAVAGFARWAEGLRRSTR